MNFIKHSREVGTVHRTAYSQLCELHHWVWYWPWVLSIRSLRILPVTKCIVSFHFLKACGFVGKLVFVNCPYREWVQKWDSRTSLNGWFVWTEGPSSVLFRSINQSKCMQGKFSNCLEVWNSSWIIIFQFWCVINLHEYTEVIISCHNHLINSMQTK